MRELSTENITVPKLLWDALMNELQELRVCCKGLHTNVHDLNKRVLKLQKENEQLENVIKELCDLIKDSY